MASVISSTPTTRPEFLPAIRDRTSEYAERCLRASAYFELRASRCRCQDGVLSLHGTVSSFYLKQIAQTLVAKLPGVLRVDNQLNVLSE